MVKKEYDIARKVEIAARNVKNKEEIAVRELVKNQVKIGKLYHPWKDLKSLGGTKEGARNKHPHSYILTKLHQGDSGLVCGISLLLDKELRNE